MSFYIFVEQETRKARLQDRWFRVSSLSCVEAMFNKEHCVTMEDTLPTVKTSDNTTPGPNSISNDDINKLSDDDMKNLAFKFNTIIQNDEVRGEWLRCLKLLPKPFLDRWLSNHITLWLSHNNSLMKGKDTVICWCYSCISTTKRSVLLGWKLGWGF